MTLQAIKYSRGKLEILDQLKLPHQEKYLEINTPEEAWKAIKLMQVRGAPAIAIVAVLSLAAWGANHSNKSTSDMESGILIPQYFSDKLKYLVTSRPTAFNLAEAATRLDTLVWATWGKPNTTASDVIEAYIEAAEEMLDDDVEDNESIGDYGAAWIVRQAAMPGDTERRKICVLTHCNTGSLATAGYGTALGIVRSLHKRNLLQHAFYTETRPYNQGSRLTGYELLHDKIPATLVTDSTAAALLLLLSQSPQGPSAAVIVVGADRVATNGDTANKIGTYSLAILARYHGIKFIVAVPRTSIDPDMDSGAGITIEERSPAEVTSVKGTPFIQRSATDPESDTNANERIPLLATDRIEEISTAATHTQAWNPAFDITPADLIDAFVTEKGVIEKERGIFDFSTLF